MHQLLTIHPTFESFAKHYAIQNQDKCGLKIKESLCCASPTLYNLSTAYNEESATLWIFTQILHVALLTGVRKDDMLDKQIESASRNILANFPQLKATSLMLFCSRFRAGFYGHFYGTFDTIMFSEALITYIKWAREELARYNREQEYQRRERQEQIDKANAISYEEYLKIKRKIKRLRNYRIWRRRVLNFQ